MSNFDFALLLLLVLLQCLACNARLAFQTSQMLPMRIDPLPKDEIRQRLGLKQSDPINPGLLSIGSNMKYNLLNEHEVVCPVSGSHQGILCTAQIPSISQSSMDSDNSESIANNHELVSQAILSGSLAASIRNRCKDGNGMYYLPVVITLVESLMADEIESIDLNKLDLGKMMFNSEGLETNEILMDLSGYDDDDVPAAAEEQSSVMLYACNSHFDQTSATSDVYLLPSKKGGKIWRFSVDFKVCHINLQMINSFGDNDSATPLRPDVWLKDDSY
jgi:hypothetical protein